MLIRLLGAIALLGIAGFCVFGFMATFEYPDIAERLPWQMGYGAVGLACITGVFVLLRRRRGRDRSRDVLH